MMGRCQPQLAHLPQYDHVILPASSRGRVGGPRGGGGLGYSLGCKALTCCGDSLLYQACQGVTTPSHFFTSCVSLLLLTPAHSLAFSVCMAAVHASVPVWGTAMSWSPL
jgi:hypothetical protein